MEKRSVEDNARIDVPPVEAREASLLVFRRDPGLMEGRVRRVLEHRLSEPLVVVHRSIADELHLRDARDGLKVGMENRLLLRTGLVVAVTVALASRVKGLACIRV